MKRFHFNTESIDKTLIQFIIANISKLFSENDKSFPVNIDLNGSLSILNLLFGKAEITLWCHVTSLHGLQIPYHGFIINYFDKLYQDKQTTKICIYLNNVLLSNTLYIAVYTFIFNFTFNFGVAIPNSHQLFTIFHIFFMNEV